MGTNNSPEKCERKLRLEFINATKQKIRAAHDNDPDSKLGTYLLVIPNIEIPSYDDNLFEIERIHISRFRTGSHNLFIETGRFMNPRTPRDLRFCTCGNGIQTLRHVLMDCSTVLHSENIDKFRNAFTTVYEFFNWPMLHEYLLCISKALKIEL